MRKGVLGRRYFDFFVFTFLAVLILAFFSIQGDDLVTGYSIFDGFESAASSLFSSTVGQGVFLQSVIIITGSNSGGAITGVVEASKGRGWLALAGSRISAACSGAG